MMKPSTSLKDRCSQVGRSRYRLSNNSVEELFRLLTFKVDWLDINHRIEKLGLLLDAVGNSLHTGRQNVSVSDKEVEQTNMGRIRKLTQFVVASQYLDTCHVIMKDFDGTKTDCEIGGVEVQSMGSTPIPNGFR